ncbi:MAG TPA: MYXO-CTERM sorting domain-containing protein [Polyangiales bacterium]|nr:MYXO-CTERM sorting domain-containing protein [Polyangiales bacterium]
MTKFASRGVLIAVVLCLATPALVQADKVSNTVTFGDRSLVSTLWSPNVSVLRGVVVFTGGQGTNGKSGDTRGLVENKLYQRFAESIGFALLGNQFTGMYTEAANGPGQALVDALTQFSKTTGHPELERAPVLVQGFSNGGYFSFTFAAWKPERVIAFVVNKSGFAKAQLTPEFAAVPGLLFWGSNEPPSPTVIHQLVQQGRAQHALWAELKEWGKGHEEGDADNAIVPFLADMVAARYPVNKTPLDADFALFPLDEGTGWLGDHADASVASDVPTIAKFADYTGDKAAASWLPNEGLAIIWRAFVTKNPITLSSPMSGAQLDATKPVQLKATGLTQGQRGNFFDGAQSISSVMPQSGGAISASWNPAWGGGRGIVAVARDSAEAIKRTSRPAAIVLYGKQPPPGPPQPDPRVDPADAGPKDPRGGAGGAAGMMHPEAGAGGTSGMMPLDAGTDAEVVNDAAAADSGTDADSPDEPAADGGEDRDAGKHTSQRKSEAGCSAGGPTDNGSAAFALVLALWIVSSARRRRTHVA